MKSQKTRIKYIVFAAVFMLSTNLLLGFVLMRQARNAMKIQIDARMLDVANCAAAALDGDVLEHLRGEDQGTPEYEAVMNTLEHFRDNIRLEYIYYVRAEEDGSFSFGIDSDPVAPAEFGAPVAYTDALYRASQGEAAADDKPYEDAWGCFYSAYSPVFNSAGEVAGVVTVDFDATWYEGQLNRNTRTILLACAMFLGIGIVLLLSLNRHYGNMIKEINRNLSDLVNDMEELTGETVNDAATTSLFDLQDDSILKMGEKISRLRNDLRQHVSHIDTQANNMINAMASDYRSVYHVNLDENDGVCYRADPGDREQTPQSVHFPYLERFTWYAEHCVTEGYREGFLRFIDPDSVRRALSDKNIIAYRYLAEREGREYYEMIRMAGVRRAEERDDHTVHAVGVGFTEIDTEMRETMAKNEALVEALAMAEEANLAKTAFLSNMSHEIRTPMNAIIGLNNLALHDEVLGEHTKEYLEKIGKSARHLLGLINDILDMSRIEAGRIVLRQEEFSFSDMLEQINTMVMSQCSDKGLVYECRVLNRVNSHYIGDDTKLKEVLINILSNAIKFTEAPGRVTLSVEQTAAFEDKSTLRFRVRDTGIGMDPEYLPKIFEAFSQEDSSRKNKYGSTGLGMAITKSIVEMMNGTISVESEKGAGTEFTVVITLRNSEGRENERDGRVDCSRMNVLVVDDEEFAAEHARVTLSEAGIRTDLCTGGREALQMMELQAAKQEPYNLVLLDWRMPEMDGLETARQIRKLYGCENTVILLTAYSWDEIREEALQAGIDSFVAKPLFASAVMAEFERIARHGNHPGLIREKQRAELAGHRVLLAEDIELNAEIMTDILDMEEVCADHAENGKIAVEMFQDSEAGTYSAILMDIRMPVMDGLEAAAAIRALDRTDAKTIPIIALTANAFDEDVQRSLQVGMNAHLSKPVEPEQLYQTLGELIYECCR
ncbi:MAG: response regulator [Oscillospiraceae bacterium]|nr:response regulator [Oscillospiraceae bacterium]